VPASERTTARRPALVVLFALLSWQVSVRAAEMPAGQGDTAAPAPAIPSLMFSPADVAAIEKAQATALQPVGTATAEPVGEQAPEAESEAPPPPKPTVPNVYVSAIVDLGDGQWTVWANGYRITPGRQPPGFTVLAVADDAVDIAVTGEQPARFRLHPFQTWRSRQGDIVEGIHP